jgi:hypothetical protein
VLDNYYSTNVANGCPIPPCGVVTIEPLEESGSTAFPADQALKGFDVLFDPSNHSWLATIPLEY